MNRRTLLLIAAGWTSLVVGGSQADSGSSHITQVPVLACNGAEIQPIVREVLKRPPGFSVMVESAGKSTNCSWRANDRSEHLTVQILPVMKRATEPNDAEREAFYTTLAATGLERVDDARVRWPLWVVERNTPKNKRVTVMITSPGPNGFTINVEGVRSSPPFVGADLDTLKEIAIGLVSLLPPKAATVMR